MPSLSMKRKVKYRVVFVKRIGDGSYGGMNYYASKDLGFRFPHRKDTVTIATGQTIQKVNDTVRHEIMEAELMRKTHMAYSKAHKKITDWEKKHRK